MIFLRRTWRVASIVALVLVTVVSLSAQQQGAEAKPGSKSRDSEAAAKPSPLAAPPDPSPYTGEETRKHNQANIKAEQESATANTKIAIDTERMTDYTWWLVIVGLTTGGLQIALLFFQNLYTGRAANAAKTSADAVRLAERAFFDIAHKDRLDDGAPTAQGIPIHVRIQIKNRGRTPATVSDAVVGFKIAKSLKGQASGFKGPYPHANTHRPKAYMVPDKQFFFSGNDHVSPSDWAKIQGGSARLYVLGYLDYIDVFNERRRTGYARLYHPVKPGNNLTFFKTAGYNYDRLRVKGEGNEWD